MKSIYCRIREKLLLDLKRERIKERHVYYHDLLNTTSPVKIRYAKYIFNNLLTLSDKKVLIQICDDFYCAMDECSWYVSVEQYTLTEELIMFINCCGYTVTYDAMLKTTLIEIT